MTELARIHLTVDGLGIIFYSPWAVEHIRPGSDYLEEAFLEADDIARHVNASSLTAFATGSSGEYELIVTLGPPDPDAVQRAEFRVELGLEVRGGTVCFRDLYELIHWEPKCPQGQSLSIPDGFYRVTAFRTRARVSETQPVYLSFEKVPERLDLHFDGAPELGG